MLAIVSSVMISGKFAAVCRHVPLSEISGYAVFALWASVNRSERGMRHRIEIIYA